MGYVCTTKNWGFSDVEPCVPYLDLLSLTALVHGRLVKRFETEFLGTEKNKNIALPVTHGLFSLNQKTP